MKLFIASLCFAAALALPTSENIIDVMPRIPANPNFVPKPVKDGRIVGGEECFANSTYHQFAHAAHLHYSPPVGGGFYCTAQVIDANWIMTAGHCCVNNRDQDAPNYKLVVGAHNRQPGTTDPFDANSKQYIDGVAKVIQHERYYPSVIANDICLLQLNDALEFIQDLLQPALLATDATSIADTDGSTVYPCGWGRTSDSGGGIPDNLRWTTDLTMSDSACQSVFGIEYGPGEICIDTEDTHQGTCSGDSGGPLNIPNPAFDQSYVDETDSNPGDARAIRWITNGITSYGASAGCEAGYPDAFTDVNFYNGGTSAGVKGENWIFDNSGVGGQ